MSVSFNISSKTGDYEVSVADGNFALQSFSPALASTCRRPVFLADERFEGLIRSGHSDAIFVPANEEMKSLQYMPELIRRLRAAGVTRQHEIISVGGGTVQDASSFVASTYMRGVPWVYVPTTLLAMADSCIGGKSSINVFEYKNLVGTFWPPQRILIDVRFTKTLARRQISEGLVEAAKICYCKGQEVFLRYLESASKPTLDAADFIAIVETSLRAKKWFIEIDEFDERERLLLNFGHTFGHALESATNFRISHGIAVGVGILCAIELAHRLSLPLDKKATALLSDHLRVLVSADVTLTRELRSASLDKVLDSMLADKKHTPEHLTFILPVDDKACLIRLEKNSDALEKVRASVRNILEAFAQ